VTSLLIDITLLGGNCPVQAEGTVNGVPFYFRARGARWTMGIGGDVVGNPDWRVELPYGTDYEAGWMSLEEAEAFIRIAARLWLEQTKGKAAAE
jgi:hypothetical protein